MDKTSNSDAQSQNLDTSIEREIDKLLKDPALLMDKLFRYYEGEDFIAYMSTLQNIANENVLQKIRLLRNSSEEIRIEADELEKLLKISDIYTEKTTYE